ncbi:unnamed protein product [Spodoptera exigua]|nr:unnamed protein product [Spodoptera exigua]
MTVVSIKSSVGKRADGLPDDHTTNVDGWRGKGRPKKIRMGCVRSDMEDRGVSDSVTGDSTEWKKKNILCPQIKRDKGRKMMTADHFLVTRIIFTFIPVLSIPVQWWFSSS